MKSTKSTKSTPARHKHEFDKSYKSARAYLIRETRRFIKDMKAKDRDLTDPAVKEISPIYEAWNNPLEMRGGSLFLYATRTGYQYAYCGCLSQVHSNHTGCQQVQDDLTGCIKDEIRAESRIPLDMVDCGPDDLDVFVEWQERLDVFFAARPTMV